MREVFEETGVHTEFQGILTFRQQHKQPGAFGRSDIYFVCKLQPLTYDLVPCSHEIEACEWMSLDQLARTNETSAVTRRVIQLVKHGLEHGFSSVVWKGEEFRSIYKGLVFKMYNRVLTDLGKPQSYQHSPR